MVPNELKQLDQWVVWRWEHDDRGKPTKPPSRADGQGHADSTDPTTWTTAKDAYAKWKSNGWAGLGFVVTATDPYCGIDCDHCRDPETGAIDIWAQQLVEDFGSYTEITPTKTGIRIWTRAVHGGKEVPHKRYLRDAPNPQAAVEIYDRERYFTTTGDHLPGTPETIEEGQGALDRLATRLWPRKTSPSVPAAQAGPSLQAREIIDILSRASNSAKFGRLMAGDCSDYPSGSEADLGLLGMIVPFYTEQLEVALEIIRASGLWDDKWERRDYQERTFEKALSSDSGERYQGRLAGGEVRHGTGDAETAQESPKVVEEARKPDPWPNPPEEPAYHGLAGEIVRTIEPQSEADPVAVLAQFLTIFGIAFGERAYFDVGATRHSPRIFAGLVGRSAKARKGDSWNPVERLLTAVDGTLGARILGGFGSGEAMVHAVRDERYEQKEGKIKLVDEGVSDKRLLVLETELARLLVAVGREGSTASQYIRDAFDGRPLRNIVTSRPSAQASQHHIGVVGHTTAEELRGRLTEDQIRNGFANRFLWLAVKRSKLLPSPQPFEGAHVDQLVDSIQRRARDARMVGRMYRSEKAEQLWNDWYDDLSQERHGVIGVLAERAEALVLRLSMIYALTDGSEVILPDHLNAARALWDFAFRSLQYLWDVGTGDVNADRILEELAYGPMTRRQITDEVFLRNLQAPQLTVALNLLVERGLVVCERVSTGGRPAQRYRLP